MAFTLTATCFVPMCMKQNGILSDLMTVHGVMYTDMGGRTTRTAHLSMIHTFPNQQGWLKREDPQIECIAGLDFVMVSERI